MTRLFALSSLGLMVGVATVAAEEPTIQTFDPESAVSPVSIVEGAGWKVGEGSVLHPVFGVETGFVSNTFYEESDVTPSGILRLIAQVGVGSLSEQRLSPTAAVENEAPPEAEYKGALEYRASLRATYDFVLSDNDSATATGGLGLGASLRGTVNPSGAWSFLFDEDFARLIRAANFETDTNTNRLVNNFRMALRYSSKARSIRGELYYANTFDIFERTEQDFANRMQHTVGLRPSWQWLPKTQFYADVSLGYMAGLGDAMKVTSYPLVAKAGIATLLSGKTALNIEGGYTNGFYSEGESFSAPLVNAQLAYRYSPLGRFALLYSYNHQDSINANFFRDHTLRFWIRQLFVPFVVMVQPEVRFRQYQGIMLIPGGQPTRDDVIISVVGGMAYNFRNWMAATLSYRFTSVQTDYLDLSTSPPDDPSYARHELLVGMRFAM